MSSITWLGHSTAVVDVDGTRLITDPVLGRRVAHLRRSRRVDPAQYAGIAGVLVSHAHYDHLDLPSLRRLDRAVRVIVPAGAGRLLRKSGFSDVVEVDAGDEVAVGNVVVRTTPAEHDGRRGPFGVQAASVGYVVAGSVSVYFAGDTDIFDGMHDIGPVDVALLPVAGWGPTLPAGHMSPTSAAESLRLLRPELAVPIHWGTYRTPFARRPNDAPARAFAEAAAELAPAVAVRILQLGESCPIERSHLPEAASPR